MLYCIGLGLHDPKDVTIKGRNAIQQADHVYIETYTSTFQATISDLERFFDTEIQEVARDFVEDTNTILEQAQQNTVAFLVIGDVFSATTHYQLYQQAKQSGIHTRVIHNASIINAVSQTGLQLYKFGRTASIPFRDVETPITVLEENQRIGLHTLFLLDITEDDHMTAEQAIDYLYDHDAITDTTTVVACARLGHDDATIKAGPATQVRKASIGPPPHSIIVPGDLHFSEEEALKLWK